MAGGSGCSINAKAAESLADPAQYPNLFPNLDLALHAEQYQVRWLDLNASIMHATWLIALKASGMCKSCWTCSSATGKAAGAEVFLLQLHSQVCLYGIRLLYRSGGKKVWHSNTQVACRLRSRASHDRRMRSSCMSRRACKDLLSMMQNMSVGGAGRCRAASSQWRPVQPCPPHRRYLFYLLR